MFSNGLNGPDVCNETIRQHMIEMKLSRKKVTRVSSNGSNEKNLPRRIDWVRTVYGDSADLSKVGTVEELHDQKNWTLVSEQPAYDGVVPPRRHIIQLDETGVNQHTLRRNYGWSHRNDPCVVKDDHFRGKNHSVLICIGTNDDGTIGGVLTHKTIVGKQTGTRRSHFSKLPKEQDSQVSTI